MREPHKPTTLLFSCLTIESNECTNEAKQGGAVALIRFVFFFLAAKNDKKILVHKSRCMHACIRAIALKAMYLPYNSLSRKTTKLFDSLQLGQVEAFDRRQELDPIPRLSTIIIVAEAGW